MPRIKKENIGSNAPATKGDIEQLREDLHVDMVEHFVSKEDLKKALQESEIRVVAAIRSEIDTLREHDKEELEGKHQDELDIAMEKKEAPSTWKSIPRRLKVVEMDVEKIKDKLS